MCQSVTLLATDKESKLSAITVVSLISKCFYHGLDSVLNGTIKTLGNKIYLMQKYTALFLQKYYGSRTAQEYLMSIHVQYLLHRKAAVVAISEPSANFKYVSIIQNHTVGTAGLNSFRAITKSTK